MYDEKMKNEYELSPEEEKALDLLLKEAAEADNRAVDFDALHDKILKKARSEGIAVFARPKKKNNARRIWTGVASAAAVLVVGLAVVAVLKNWFGAGSINDNKNASLDNNTPQGDVVTETGKQGDPGKSSPTTAPVQPVVTAGPDVTQPTQNIVALETPLPKEFTRRDGSTVGYVLLAPFTAAPVASLELLPDALPDFMESTASDAEMLAASLGKNGDNVCCYKCRVIRLAELEEDLDIGVGVARYTVELSGDIIYIWHVCDNFWLEISFTGFTREKAEAMLITLPLCDLAAVGLDEAA